MASGNFVDEVVIFISIVELLGDVLATKPKETDGFDSVIIVDGIPQVGPDRLEKLKNVINKIFVKYGAIVSEYYPKDDNGNTKGSVFALSLFCARFRRIYIFLFSALMLRQISFQLHFHRI